MVNVRVLTEASFARAQFSSRWRLEVAVAAVHVHALRTQLPSARSLCTLLHLAHALLLQRLHVLLARLLLLRALSLALTVAGVLALFRRLRAQTSLQLLPLLNPIGNLFGLEKENKR